MIPVDASRLPASAIEEGRRGLVSTGRRTALFGDEQAVATGTDTESTWAGVEPRGAHGAGIRLARSGEITIWRELARDNLGSILDSDSLTEDLAELIRVGASLLRPAVKVTVTAGLEPVAMAVEGDRRDLGKRTSATLSRFAAGGSIRLEPEVLVLGSQLERSAKDIARELAIRLMQVFRAG